ncbi:hypothetical protein VP01_2828g5 [Puccinia sorghi]|uniref:Uncharacterized protein n=1 Tax=Puccinia sorghi TaxID=27349 RepID=A0A0L6V291_9BASI|nr:hypothetical protein VP01_2828g5 [Puccinia sorghi]
MPTVATQLTPAQQIIQDTQHSPERILRVVNGSSASVSTRASHQSTTSHHHHSNLSSSCNTTQPLSINNRRRSYQTTTTTSTSTANNCTKCMDLEHKLTIEVERSRALERALEEQTHKLEQFRNWSTAKVTTLDHALQAQERLLQQVERRMAEKHDKPDIKSDYLIALQKDFVELNARLAALEGKQDNEEEEEEDDEVPVNNDATEAQENHSQPRSPSPQHAILGRTTPLAYVSRLLEERSLIQDGRDKVRAYSTPPLAVATRRAAAQPASAEPGRSLSPWKPSSPANLASKLVPPTTPGSPNSNSRSAPATPTSRSPRPRYTTALGNKAPSPLGFSSAARTPESSNLNHPGSAGSSPSKDTQFSRYRQSVNPTQQHHYARPTLASSRYAAATAATITATTTTTHVVSPTGRRFSTGYNKNRPNRPPLVPVTPLAFSSSSNFPPLGRKKAAVGDLIKIQASLALVSNPSANASVICLLNIHIIQTATASTHTTTTTTKTTTTNGEETKGEPGRMFAPGDETVDGGKRSGDQEHDDDPEGAGDESRDGAEHGDLLSILSVGHQPEDRLSGLCGRLLLPKSRASRPLFPARPCLQIVQVSSR